MVEGGRVFCKEERRLSLQGPSLIAVFCLADYYNKMTEDTIIAISTPPGYGGIGIIRLSGKRALPLSKKIFRAKKATKIPPRQPVLGYLYDSRQKDDFEEGFLTYFPGPRSYTGEDVVEISCHGSPVILEELIRLGVKAGARHADPGEFTLRAYLNGRIDILQAEAVNDIIRASSLTQAKISFRQKEGRLSTKIKTLREEVIHCLALAEAGLEFPDEGLRISSKRMAMSIEKVLLSLKRLIASYDLGRTMREGIKLALVGRANVGKSTLFNALLDQERAIVTPYPGTTRDYLSERVLVKQALVTLVDTAGMATSDHPVEQEGIKRSKRLAAESDGLLFLLDASQRESPEDRRLLERFQDRKMILLVNKIDLPRKMDTAILGRWTRAQPLLEISALKRINLERLRDKIHEFFVPQKAKSEEVILHLRQKLILEQMAEALERGLARLRQEFSEEYCVEEIRTVLPLFARLTGEIRAEEVIQNIFGRFCVGK